MSFILDALRKSEAARRRNEAPDLFTAMPERAETGVARTSWPMWAVAGVGVVSLAVAAWLFLHRAPAVPTQATSAPAQAMPGPSVAPPAPGVAPSTPAPVAPMPGPRPDTQPTSGPAVVSVPPPVTAPTPATQAPVAATRTPQAPSPAPSETTLAPPPPSTEPQPAPRVAARANGGGMLALSDLDPGTRKQLPPLKISMHLWNETPSRRFVIIDGQRLGEGDMLGDAMIESITRDGAVLNWQGSRLRLEMR